MKGAAAFLTVFLTAILFNITVCANAYSSNEINSEKKSVYVAGSSECFPVEYFDKTNNCYKGILPEILKIISENTEYDFKYISNGKTDNRLELAKNCQVEIVSACNVLEEDFSKNLDLTKTILEFSYKGQEYSVAFGFTEVADDNLKKDFRKALQNICESKISTLCIESSLIKDNDITSKSMLVVSIIIAVALFIVFSIIILFFRINGKKYKTKIQCDNLTGLGNIEFFNKVYSDKLITFRRSNHYLVYIGFEAEKVINCIGIKEYQCIMKYASERIKINAQPNDIIAKVFDDSFAVIREACTPKDIEKWAHKLLDVLNNYELDNCCYFKTAFRCGIYPINTNLENGEKAIYNALQGYRCAVIKNKPIVFSHPDILIDNENIENYKKRIATAIKENEFVLYLQLIINVKSGEFDKAEVLSRWDHPEKGIIKAHEYLNLIYQLDLIEEYDLYIFSKTCELLEDFNKNGNANVALNCNITQRTLSSECFADNIENIISQYTFNHSNLTIEITEDSLITNNEMAFSNIEACKQLGIRIALDDMGAGYTSMASLFMYSVDEVKIDRDIILASKSEKNQKLLKGFISLAHSLNLSVICEGIEDSLTADIVKHAECDYIQGFYYSRPLPISEVKNSLKKKCFNYEQVHKNG